jgi:hypothetical protein
VDSSGFQRQHPLLHRCSFGLTLLRLKRDFVSTFRPIVEPASPPWNREPKTRREISAHTQDDESRPAPTARHFSCRQAPAVGAGGRRLHALSRVATSRRGDGSIPSPSSGTWGRRRGTAGRLHHASTDRIHRGLLGSGMSTERRIGGSRSGCFLSTDLHSTRILINQRDSYFPCAIPEQGTRFCTAPAARLRSVPALSGGVPQTR